jgi:hypothetical protein
MDKRVSGWIMLFHSTLPLSGKSSKALPTLPDIDARDTALKKFGTVFAGGAPLS